MLVYVCVMKYIKESASSRPKSVIVMASDAVPARAIGVVGFSGSGKSVWSRAEAGKYDSVFVVGGSLEGAETISYADVKNKRPTEGSLVVFEDLVRPSSEEIGIIKQLLVYDKRHRKERHLSKGATLFLDSLRSLSSFGLVAALLINRSLRTGLSVCTSSFTRAPATTRTRSSRTWMGWSSRKGGQTTETFRTSAPTTRSPRSGGTGSGAPL